MKRMALAITIICTVIVFCCLKSFADCAPASSQAKAVENSLFANYNWVMEISVNAMPNYLTHSGTKLGRVSRVHLTVRSLSNRNSVQSNDYEELYYSDSTAIGVRSLQPLNLPNGSIGAIMVVDTGNYLNTNTGASVAANALTRAYVEIAVKNAVSISVICPQHAISAIESAMAVLRFFPINRETESTDESSTLDLHFRSDVNAEEQIFVFSPTNSN